MIKPLVTNLLARLNLRISRKSLSGFVLGAATGLAALAVLSLSAGETLDPPAHAMSMMTQPTAQSYVERAVNLPRTGWTATASDQNPNNPASYVLDGSNATFWHSKYAAPATPLPHSITIDMHATKVVAGLTYVPRQDTVMNGNVGRYSISTSLNGTTWSAPVTTGTWSDDRVTKTAAFKPVSTRFVRLTAATEAGNRGPWTSAAEINLTMGVIANPPLPRTGWVATASDQYIPAPASNVLDGNATTFWHSSYAGTPIPLPHSITIDMRASKVVTGLAYLPRSDASKNGNIGKYTIQVSSNNTTWTTVASGTWADDTSEKIAPFAAVSAQYVKLTATTEAANRGPWTSAAEINILGQTPTAAVGGTWSPVIGLPEVPASAVLLPNNKVLTFAAMGDTRFDHTATTTRVSILDLNTGLVAAPSTINTQHQMFCTGLSILADGRVLITGGSTDGATTIYNPLTNTWTKGPLMLIPRGYQSSVTLSNGRVFTLGGSWDNGAGNKNGEIFTPSGASGAWAKLIGVTADKIVTADPGGVYRADNHTWLFAASDGAVFQAGPSKQMNWITTSGAGTITGAGNRSDSLDAMNGNAVMYDIGKIFTAGGAIAYQDAGTVKNVQATVSSYLIDISQGRQSPVTTTKGANMSYARAFANSVVLPDGKVIVLGGQQHPEPFTDTGAVRSPELWDPATNSYTILAPMAIPRTYHSVALLLPDGRVFSAGGGLCTSCTTNHADGEIFTPPYLLNSDGSLRTRPAITSAPTTATTGTSISVSTNTSATSFSLVRTSSVTHSINTDQRRIPLTPQTTAGTTYGLQLPSDKGVLLPGDYMLFAMDANGTPSIAKFIRIN